MQAKVEKISYGREILLFVGRPVHVPVSIPHAVFLLRRACDAGTCPVDTFVVVELVTV